MSTTIAPDEQRPAFPTVDDDGAGYDSGLTKLEYTCIKLGVALSGNSELDFVINESRKQKLIEIATQGLLVNMGRNGYNDSEAVAAHAVEVANHVLEAETLAFLKSSNKI